MGKNERDLRRSRKPLSLNADFNQMRQDLFAITASAGASGLDEEALAYNLMLA